MPTTTIPLLPMPSQREQGTTDARAVNVVVEPVLNPLTRKMEAWARKRPGLINSTQPPAGAATGRGLYAWGATGKIYSVFNNKLFSGITDLLMTLDGSSGRAWWVETPASSSAQLLIMSDGADNYNTTTGDVTTQIDQTDDADYPQANLGPIAYLTSGRILQGQSNGRITQSNANAFTAWTAGGFLSVDTHGGALEAIHGHKDQVIGFTTNRTEFFYDNGNPSGSVLKRHNQNTFNFGIATKNSLAWSGELRFFVGQSPAEGDGSRVVWQVSAGSVKDVSTPVINRFLAAEGSSISSMTAWCERIAGQVVYLINLSSANRTFVFFPDTGIWLEWQAAGGGKFPGIHATSLDGAVYVQDAANGRIYTTGAAGQDSGAAYDMVIQLEKGDKGTSFRKFAHYVELVADAQASGTTTLEASDDDGTTYTTLGTFDMTSEVKRIYRCGSYRGGRIYRLTHSANTAWRGQAIRENYSQGA